MKHKNPGNFANDPKRAARAGQAGGTVSPGNFKFDRARAADAGRRGGKRRSNRQS